MRILALVAAITCVIPARADTQDVLFLGGSRPVTIRVTILIDGLPFRSVYQKTWDEYLKALFRHLDKDGDGFLSEAEGQRLPPPSLQSGGGPSSRPTNLAFNFRVVDSSGDAKLDLKEVAAYYRDYGSDAVQIASPPLQASIPATVSSELFATLDSNRDGALSGAELAAAKSLNRLDQDADDLLTAQEISPRTFAVSSNGARPLGAAAPRTGRSESHFGFPGVESQEALNRRFRQKFSGDPEIAAERVPNIELVVRLGVRQVGEKAMEILKINDPALKAHVTPSGLLVWLSDLNSTLEIHVNDGRPLPIPRASRQIVDQFQAADIARKGHLSIRDAQMRGFYPQQFELLDRDLDGKLTEKELVEYLENVQVKQAKAVTSIVSVMGSEMGRNLFDLLDTNRDNRLSSWELQAAPGLLDQVGRASMGISEIPNSFHFAIGLCQSSFNRNGGYGSFSPRGLPMLSLDWSPPDLVWFNKMDRNRDGFVTPREFLGPLEEFRKLDTNSDGLVGPEEASRALRK